MIAAPKLAEDGKPARHFRHHGVMIDASFNKAMGVDYYVVQGSGGRFYSVAVAMEIAEGIAKRRARK